MKALDNKFNKNRSLFQWI